ncbi:LLM class flavin-dependent oxidoreductase [Streptomyces sp. NPDC051940]|uniref:LLM class flavin-dependent oxidoreductase n=1 Tax=Streptomyces sp. NPDC051940 TaxID=3155675 RepID=UPI00343F03B3
MPVTVIRFNQATPGLDPAEVSARYRATVEMAAFAEERGFNMITLEEHHGADDGWSPAPLVTAAALLAATRRINVMVSAALTPLYDPLRLAEEAAVADHLGGRPGRLSLVAGLGYRPQEYAAFGREWKERGRLQDEVLETLLAAWTGEPFDYRGTRVRVTPPPLTRPHPPLLVGGSSRVAVRRAVRLGLPFFSAAYKPELVAYYRELAAAAGLKGGFALLPPERTRLVHCTEDPERAWALYGRHFLHEARTYASWYEEGQTSAVLTAGSTAGELRAEGVYACLTPEECVAEGAGATFVLHPMCGGLPVEGAWESLRLFADKVLPALQAPA